MYIKPVLALRDPGAAAADLVRQHIFGTLVTATPAGPTATHLPFLLDSQHPDEPHGVLHSHLAAANDHADGLDGAQALVILLGPHGYISSSWYAERDSAPTWNYTAVHAAGTVRVNRDPKATLAHLAQLTAALETGRPRPWHLRELGTEGLHRRLDQIVYFTIAVTDLQVKFKLGQDERSGDTAAAIAALQRDGQHALAQLMRVHNPDLQQPPTAPQERT